MRKKQLTRRNAEDGGNVGNARNGGNVGDVGDGGNVRGNICPLISLHGDGNNLLGEVNGQKVYTETKAHYSSSHNGGIKNPEKFRRAGI